MPGMAAAAEGATARNRSGPTTAACTHSGETGGLRQNRRRRGKKRSRGHPPPPRALPNSQAKGQRGAPRAASRVRSVRGHHGRPAMSQTASSPAPVSLRDLEHHDAFLERHIGPNDAEIAQMLRVVGHDSLDAMTDAIVPGIDQVARAAGAAARDHRSRSAGQDPRDRRQEPGVPQLHRPGLLRHPHARTSSCATSSRTRPGTPPTRRTRRRSRRAAWKR